MNFTRPRSWTLTWIICVQAKYLPIVWFQCDPTLCKRHCWYSPYLVRLSTEHKGIKCCLRRKNEQFCSPHPAKKEKTPLSEQRRRKGSPYQTYASHTRSKQNKKCTGYFYWDRRIASPAKPKYEDWLMVGLCNFGNKFT